MDCKLSAPTQHKRHECEQSVFRMVYSEQARLLTEGQVAGGPDDGALPELPPPAHFDGWHNGRTTAYMLSRLLEAWLYPPATGQLDVDFAGVASRALAFLERRQLPDGRLDLGGGYSPNEAGFPIPGLAVHWKPLEGVAPEGFRERLKSFLLRGGEAVLAGHAYTANHRWTAACAPLASLHALWPDERYIERIEDYLADGIDVNSEGLWEYERSPGYNMVASLGLLVVADALARPELLEPVVRNARFLLHFIQPGGACDSSFSHRQDRHAPGARVFAYAVLRRVAQLTGDGRFTTLLDQQLEDPSRIDYGFVPLLTEIAAHPESLPEPEAVEDHYECFLPVSQIARTRRGGSALTLTADRGGHFFDTVLERWPAAKRSADWLQLVHEDITLSGIELVAAGATAFQPLRIIKSQEGWLLDETSRGMIHTLHFRPGSPRIEIPWGFKTRAQVTWAGNNLSIHLESSSSSSLGASLNFWFRTGVRIREGSREWTLKEPGIFHDLDGGQPVEIQSESAKIAILGLPPSIHKAHFGAAGGIPGAIKSTCASLSLGFRFPVNLQLAIELQRNPAGLTARDNKGE